MRGLPIGQWVAIAVRWSIAMAPATVCAQAVVPDTIGQRLLACSACHGKEGVANGRDYFPRIAGKPAGYLYNQLHNFREGRRSNATMASLVSNMTDAYLMEIATYYATLDLPYAEPSASPVESQVLSRGQTLVERGDASIGVPACVRCHGEALTGTMPAFPGLVGLRKDYLLAQFGGWRTGERRAAAPDCMREISERLSVADLGALASYLSRQPVPRAPEAASSVTLPLPLKCGSGTK